MAVEKELDESIAILKNREIKWEDLLSVRNVGQTGSEAGLALHNGESIDTFGQRGGPTIVGEEMVQYTGCFYYEVVLGTSNFFQLGWATPSFVAKPDEGKGCGDDEEGMSWGYNGGEGGKELRHARLGQKVEPEYGVWKANDVVGLGIDIDQCTIIIFVNNVEIFKSTSYEGKYFQDGVYPAVSLSRGSHCQIRFGSWDTPLLNDLPPGFQCWRIPEKFYSLSEDNLPSKSSHVPIVTMNDGSNSYSTNQAGMLMVHMMGRGIEYEARKNALVGVGLKWAQKILNTKIEKAKSACDESSTESIILNSIQKDQLLAIIVYTLGHAPYPPLYRFFNSDTRKGMGGVSGNDFPILFQLLEDGVRAILGMYMKMSLEKPVNKEAKEEKDNDNCTESSLLQTESPHYPCTTYRGVGIRFKANVGDKIRFGQFTSTSANPSVANDFIAQEGAGGSLLTIKSKLGAPIWELSEFPKEMEVLVPPCEPFQVVQYEEEGRFIVLESLVTSDLAQEYVDNVEAAVKIAAL